MSPPPALANHSDQDVVALILQGSAEAYRELLRRYQGRVHDLIYHVVGQHEAAQDLTQDTFLKTFQKLARYQPERPFSPWILRIARNTAVDYLRRMRKDSRALDGWLYTTPGKRLTHGIPALDQTPSDPQANLDWLRFRLAFKQAVRQLKQPYRRCYVLREIKHRSYDEIATALHMPEGTVRSYVTRAQQQLKEILMPQLDHLQASSP